MHENRWGFWIEVKDRASAENAVRMAGLPVLLIGASFFMPALLLLTTPNAVGVPTRAIALGASGIVIIVIAFLIRGGRAALVPVATAIAVPVLLFEISLRPTLFTAVPFMALLLSISGLRGWLWLHRNAE